MARHTGPMRSDRAPAPTSFHQVLIILFGSMFLAGGSDDLVDRVEAALPAGEARVRAAGIAGRLQSLGDRELQSLHDARRSFFVAFESDDASEVEMRQILERSAGRLRTYDEEAVDIVLELREAIGPDDWSDIFPGP